MLTKKNYEHSRKRHREELKQSRHTRKSMTLTLIVLLFSFSGFLGYYLYSSDDFLIKNTVLNGVEQTEQKAIDAKVKQLLGKNIFFADITGLAESISALPWVQSVEIKRLFPDSLSISLNERSAAFWLQKGDEKWLVDEQGVALFKGENKLFELPLLTYAPQLFSADIITGEKVSLVSLPYAMKSLRELRKEVANFDMHIVSIKTDDAKTFRLLAKGDSATQGESKTMEILVIKGIAVTGGAKLKKILADYKNRKGKDPHTIDFRFNNMIIMRG